MSKNYDNWEKLVTAVIRRERDKQIALSHSISSTSSSFDLSLRLRSISLDVAARLLPFPTQASELLPDKYSEIALDHSDWQMMLPQHKQEIVWKHLSLSFFRDERTGKNCFLVGVTNLEISSEGGSLRRHCHPKSRYEEVVEIKFTKMIHIQCTMKTQMLSPNTSHAAILVYGSTEDFPVSHKANTSIKIVQAEPDDPYSREQQHVTEENSAIVHFQTGINNRKDGWNEVELVHIGVCLGYNSIVIESELAVLNGYWKSGLVIEGIELRPWGSPPLKKIKIGGQRIIMFLDWPEWVRKGLDNPDDAATAFARGYMKSWNCIKEERINSNILSKIDKYKMEVPNISPHK